MGRFTDDDRIEYDRLYKQAGKCAACGDPLTKESRTKGEQGAWQAHHIDGDPDNNDLSNCTVLCINDPNSCHLNVGHSGNFDGGELAPKSRFTLQRDDVFYP